MVNCNFTLRLDLVLISIFTVGASAAGSNIRIEAPRPGNYPDMYPTVNSSTIYILGVDWYESGEYENGYHRMYSGEEFEKNKSILFIIYIYNINYFFICYKYYE